MPAHIYSSSICRIDLFSSATMVLPTSQQGKTLMAAGRAKMGVNYSQGTAFYAVSLAIGHQSVHPVAGCNCYLHSYLSRMSYSQKTERWEVCLCIQASKFAGLELDIPLDSVCNEGIAESQFLAGDDVMIICV